MAEDRISKTRRIIAAGNGRTTSSHHDGKQGYYIEDRSFSIPELKILIDAVCDRFDEGVTMTFSDEGRVLATVRVQVSPTFWAWLFQFAGDMKIAEPEDLVREYRERAEKVCGD